MSERFEKLTDFERKLLEGIKKNVKGRSKFCIYNAIHHLKMAFKIKNLDPEMALFRAITAEEEVSRAIFIILKDQKYINADKIKDQEHKYKQSLSIFIGLIENFFYKSLEKNSLFEDISLFMDNEEKLQLKIKLKEKEAFSPIPPLNFSLCVNDETYNFEKELGELISKSDFKDFEKLIKKEINLRNEILYANDKGRIVIKDGLNEGLEKYYKTVFKLIIIYSLIYPYKKSKSDFVQNALHSYLFVLLKIENKICYNNTNSIIKGGYMTKNDILEKLSEKKDYIQNTFEVEKIGLFGSYAKDMQTENSDIDIYVEFKNKTFKNISGLWVFLEELYNKKIDLMHKHKRSNGAIFDKIQKEVIYG